MPTKTEQQELENRMGAKFQGERLYWTGPKVTAQLSRYGNKVTEGFVVVGLTEYVAKIGGDRQEKAKKAAEDF